MFIILLIWAYNKKIEVTEKFMAVVFLGLYATLLFTPQNFGVIQKHHWGLITSSVGILNIFARVPQIITNWKNKSTGAMAFPTFLLMFLGATARLATVCVESDDLAFRAPYIIGFVLNTIIIIQFALYWNSTTDKKKVDDKKSKKE